MTTVLKTDSKVSKHLSCCHREIKKKDNTKKKKKYMEGNFCFNIEYFDAPEILAEAALPDDASKENSCAGLII
eukprot:1821024-Ditylum_brightwellii.AAC.1